MVTDFKPQSQKAIFPILVTELGIVTDFKLLQPSKVLFLILVTEFGIVTDVKLLQSKYLEVIDYQLFAVNTVEK